jgi:hypothetical protein
LFAAPFLGTFVEDKRLQMESGGMQTVRSVAALGRTAVTAFLVASQVLPALAAEDIGAHRLVVAQGGGFEKLPPLVAPTPYSPNVPSSSSSSPRSDSEPKPRPDPEPAPSSPDRQNSSSNIWWGAIAFTADGSYSSAWKMPSQPEAEAKVLRQCARFGRGGCEVVSFSGQQCASLATFIGPYRRRRWNLSFTAGGVTYPEASNAAMARCNSDERTQGHCQPRTTACADGR